jgi:hypothetical protein
MEEKEKEGGLIVFEYRICSYTNRRESVKE